MSITMYEAIALYDYEQNKQVVGDGTVTSFIIHMDMGQIGVCSCSDAGVKLLGQTQQQAETSLYEDFVGRLALMLKEADSAEAKAQWETQIEGMNPLVKRYLRSGKMMDGEAFKSYTGTAVLKVSELDSQFEGIVSKWNRVLEEGSRLLAELKISQEDIRILPVGELAKSYYAEYVVKSYFCATPFLPDPRFVDSIQKEDITRLIQSGEEIHRSRSVVGHEIVLMYWDSGQDGNGAERTHILASAKQAMKELEQVAYWKGLLVEKEEGITLRVDGKPLKIELPYMLAADAVDKVDIALKAVERQLLLSIRRTEMPSKLYDIPLEKYGIGKEQA